MTCSVLASKSFANGNVYALRTTSGGTVETTDTFLPMYTQDAIGRKTNVLERADYGDRKNRWMIGVSTLSGCPVKCRFCACNEFTERKGWKALSVQDMLDQVEFVLKNNPEYSPANAQDFKVLFTRMGEPGLNSEAVLGALTALHDRFPNATAAISTIGVATGDFLEGLLARSLEWRKDFIQLQFSLHSTDEAYRKWIIPVKLLSFEALAEFGQRWKANPKNQRKITLNFTLTTTKEENDTGRKFDPQELGRRFDPSKYFIKLSPLNENVTSNKNHLVGLVAQTNY